MAKKPTNEHVKAIKKAVEDATAIIGTKLVEKSIRNNELKTVYLSENAPEEVVIDVRRNADIAGVEVIALRQNNEELGIICKKPFSISVLGIKK